MKEKQGWQLDRRVPLAVVMTVLLQMAGALIWSAQLDARVSNLEQETLSTSGLNEKFARLEERLDGLKEMMGAMKRQVDHLADRFVR